MKLNFQPFYKIAVKSERGKSVSHVAFWFKQTWFNRLLGRNGGNEHCMVATSAEVIDAVQYCKSQGVTAAQTLAKMSPGFMCACIKFDNRTWIRLGESVWGQQRRVLSVTSPHWGLLHPVRHTGWIGPVIISRISSVRLTSAPGVHFLRQ